MGSGSGHLSRFVKANYTDSASKRCRQPPTFVQNDLKITNYTIHCFRVAPSSCFDAAEPQIVTKLLTHLCAGLQDASEQTLGAAAL